MSLKSAALALATLAFGLSGCAETAKLDAAGDVHAFLLSIRDGDAATFNAHVDRQALKTQIRARLMAEAARHGGYGGLAMLGVLLGRRLVDAAADQLIQPDVFRAVADYLGYSADTQIPGQLVIAEALRPVDANDVCVSRGRGPCLLVFRNEDGVWRLTDFDGDLSMLRGPRKR